VDRPNAGTWLALFATGLLSAACASGGGDDAGTGGSAPGGAVSGAGAGGVASGDAASGAGAAGGGATGSSTAASSGAGGSTQGGGTISSDDFPSIQDAIDSLEATGGAVYIPEGGHLVTEKIRVHSNITVFGAGMDKTVIELAPNVPKDHLMGNDSSSGQTNITIRDLTLRGPGPDPGINDCCYGLKLENLTNSFVIDVGSDEHGRDGFYLGYKLKSGTAKGVYGTRISGCRAKKNGRNGLSITHGSDNVIDNDVFDENNTNELVAAIDLEPDEDLEVSHNKIVQNEVSGNANNGIALYSAGGSYVVSENAVCDNSVTGNDGTGIADNGDGNYFVGNDTSGNGAGESLDGSANEGDQYAGECGTPLPDLPAAPPLPAKP
jgi:hypothetical protein